MNAVAGQLKGRRSAHGTSSESAPTRRHRPDYQIVLFTGMLVLIGLVTLFSISQARVVAINANGGDLNQLYFMIRQLAYVLIGVVAFVVAAQVPLAFWRSIAGKLMVFALGLSVFLWLSGLLGLPWALNAGGATRWYNLGFISFQPAEVLKFGVLLFMAALLARRMKEGKVSDVHETLIPVGILIGVSSLCVIVFQKDMGTGITLIGIALSMVFLAGIRFKLLVTALAAVIALGILLIITSPHRMERVVTFFNPMAASEAEGYHIQQALMTIGTGGLTGKGLGYSISAFGYLPEAQNDSIFAVMGEVFGFIGIVVILAIFAALLVRLLKVHDHVADPFQRMLVAGVFGWIATHTVVNIGAMLGVFPLTGVTLPFVSFGGTSLLFMMVALGIAYHVSRYTSHTVTPIAGAAPALPQPRRGRTPQVSRQLRQSGSWRAR